MAKKKGVESPKDLALENEKLRSRLRESEELLAAIQRGEVDAIVVSSSKGEQIYSLSSSETPYRYFIEEMNQGAVMIAEDRTIVFCNKRFSTMLQTPEEKLLGSDFLDYIDESEKNKFTELFHTAAEKRSNGEFTLYLKDNTPINLQLSFNSLSSEYPGNICIVATDLTEQKNLDKVILNKIIETEEKEKRRFANDLHDDLGPTLSTIKLELAMLESPVMESSKNEILKRCDNLLKEAVDKLRSISNNMLPRLLDTYGLDTALTAFLAKIQAEFKLSVAFKSNLEGIRFDEEAELHIYRILSELVNNTLKHSGTLSAKLDLNFNKDILTAIYTDGGRGYELIRKPNESAGLGLQIITNRISLLDGRIVFLKKGEKTEVIMKIRVKSI